MMLVMISEGENNSNGSCTKMIIMENIKKLERRKNIRKKIIKGWLPGLFLLYFNLKQKW